MMQPYHLEEDPPEPVTFNHAANVENTEHIQELNENNYEALVSGFWPVYTDEIWPVRMLQYVLSKKLKVPIPTTESFMTSAEIGEDDAQIHSLIEKDPDLFKSDVELFAFVSEKYPDDAWQKEYLNKVVATRPIDQRRYDMLSKAMADPYEYWLVRTAFWGDFNLAFATSKGPEALLTRTLRAFGVNSGWLKLKPVLLSFMVPEWLSALKKFTENWDKSYQILTHLFTRTERFIERTRQIQEGGPLLSDDQKTQFQTQNQQELCDALAPYLADPNRLDEIESGFWKLRQTLFSSSIPYATDAAPVEGKETVSFSDVIDTALPKPPSFENILDYFAIQVPSFVRTGIRDSLWWFQVYRMAWDAICQSTLDAYLSRVIEATIPKQIVTRDKEVRDLLTDAATKFANKEVTMQGARNLVRRQVSPLERERVMERLNDLLKRVAPLRLQPPEVREVELSSILLSSNF